MIGTAAGYLHWIRNWWRMRPFRASVRERSAVMIVLFHGLFRNRREAASGVCDPQQGITAAFFGEFVESLLAQRVAIRELVQALRCPQDGLTAVITFDDGYFNNVYALGVLEQFGVPATFFISTKHVQEQKSFWWDAMYREARKRGSTDRVIRRQVQGLKRLRAKEIEGRIAQWFGPRALKPVSDCDRPFSTAELAAFARSPYVFLGNHTSDHAILVNYESQGIRDQVEEAQRFLTRIIGTAPKSIAYPNGSYDARVLEIARSAGLEFGLTTRTGLNLTAMQQPMELHRLTVWSVPSAARQGRVLGSLAWNGEPAPIPGSPHHRARQWGDLR
jgi:peptidoglycan/xylan/chitin deacetylase (PgdA/CDA1 family)